MGSIKGSDRKFGARDSQPSTREPATPTDRRMRSLADSILHRNPQAEPVVNGVFQLRVRRLSAVHVFQVLTLSAPIMTPERPTLSRSSLSTKHRLMRRRAAVIDDRFTT